MEIPIKMDDLGVPPFSETPIWINMGEYHQDEMKQFLSPGIVTMASWGTDPNPKRGLPKCRDLSTVPETNIAPENGWLEDYFPFGSFWDGLFS